MRAVRMIDGVLHEAEVPNAMNLEIGARMLANGKDHPRMISLIDRDAGIYQRDGDPRTYPIPARTWRKEDYTWTPVNK